MTLNITQENRSSSDCQINWYEIDSLMAIYEDLGSKIGPMNLPMHPEYKNKDEHFL